MTAGSVAVPTIVPLRPPLTAKSKTSVDSNTKIELRSETPDTDIYYTINGSKPEPFQKIGEKCTLKYRGPFTLPAGKRPVKAVAVTKDGIRESNVVTKVFEVEYVPVEPLLPEDDGLSFQHQMEKERRELEVKRAAKNYLLSSTKSAWTDLQRTRDTDHMAGDLDTRRSDIRQTGTNRFSTSRMGANTDRSLGFDTERSAIDYVRDRRSIPDNSTQPIRLQRETDFLKCVYCFADRPSDPYARFCHECGNPVPPVPQTRATRPEAGQMGMCSFCHSMVPYNVRSCVVCEAPIPGQRSPSPNHRLAEKKVCTLCGTANPSSLNSCLTCDARLPIGSLMKGVYSGMSAPPLPKSEGKLLQCTKCGRVNNGDSRFCDWCGAKPDQPSTKLVCSKCRASNHPYANFCGSCGVKIEAPMRNGFISTSIDGHGSLQPQWKPVTLPLGGSIASRPSASVATQTVGLFYPSQTEILKHQQKEQERQAIVKTMSDKQPVLTAVSPGRGYWRKQMDHICQHLKTYAANNAEFRALIGEPRMGKLSSVTIDEDSYQLSVTANFILRGTRDHLPENKTRLNKGDFLRSGDFDSYSERETVSEPTTPVTSARSRKGVKKTKKPKKKDVEKLNAEDRKLLKEVGVEGEGEAAEIQHLIDEGADPCLVNKDDLPLLHVAVKNKHAEAIPVIIQAGADVNKKGPPSIKGNTALHEAVSLGSSGLDVIEALLENGADIQKKNDRGESSYDLAAKGNYETIVKKFASTLGQSQLLKMTKPKY